MKKEQYKELQRRCKKAGTYCPEENIIHSEIANTPLYLRIYFEMVGEE